MQLAQKRFVIKTILFFFFTKQDELETFFNCSRQPQYVTVK